MASETVEHRGYSLIIYLPLRLTNQGWCASVRNPNNQLTGLRPMFRSRAEAVKAARDHVNQELDKKAAP